MFLKKDNTVYVMPSLSSLEAFDFATRAKAQPKALAHGGILSEDDHVETRNVEVEVIIEGENIHDYIVQTNELKRYAYQKDQRLYISDNRYINVAGLIKFKEKYIKGFYMVKSIIDLTFLAIDPFVYQDGMEEITKTITGTPAQFTVDNPGNIDTPAVITITASASATSINLKNITDNNRQFDYNDVQMVTGEVLTVDAINGTVYRGSVNTINNFGGTFIKLLPGDNVIQYTGGNCSIKIEFPVRWL